MHIHVRMHRWVLWWIYLGVAGGVVALANILFRDPTRTQDKIILVAGIAHWVLGGLVCYAYDAIRIEDSSRKPVRVEPSQARERRISRAGEREEWHPASDFLLPGTRKSLLPPKRSLGAYKWLR